jgi:hypothetical protein
VIEFVVDVEEPLRESADLRRALSSSWGWSNWRRWWVAARQDNREVPKKGYSQTGISRVLNLHTEGRAIIEHVLADGLGDWRVSIVGSQANDRWEMKIAGPNAFARPYTLEGSAGEHRPEVIQVILSKMLPGRKA